MLIQSEVSVPLLRGKGCELHCSISKQFYISRRTFFKDLNEGVLLCYFPALLPRKCFWSPHKMVFTAERHFFLTQIVLVNILMETQPNKSFKGAMRTRLQTLCSCILQNRETMNMLQMYQKLVCRNVTYQFIAGRQLELSLKKIMFYLQLGNDLTPKKKNHPLHNLQVILI